MATGLPNRHGFGYQSRALIIVLDIPDSRASRECFHAQALARGCVAEAKNIEYELVVKPDIVQLHVRDHGKSLDVSEARAVVTLLTETE